MNVTFIFSPVSNAKGKLITANKGEFFCKKQ